MKMLEDIPAQDISYVRIGSYEARVKFSRLAPGSGQCQIPCYITLLIEMILVTKIEKYKQIIIARWLLGSLPYVHPCSEGLGNINSHPLGTTRRASKLSLICPHHSFIIIDSAYNFDNNYLEHKTYSET